MTDQEYKELSIREFSKVAKVYETNDAGVYRMCRKDYPDVLAFFNSVYRVLRPGGRLILRDMTAKTAAVRWFMNHIEMPVINLAGHGDVHVYGTEEVRALCNHAGLSLELGEKRGFFRLHCVARKPDEVGG